MIYKKFYEGKNLGFKFGKIAILLSIAALTCSLIFYYTIESSYNTIDPQFHNARKTIFILAMIFSIFGMIFGGIGSIRDDPSIYAKIGFLLGFSVVAIYFVFSLILSLKFLS